MVSSKQNGQEGTDAIGPLESRRVKSSPIGRRRMEVDLFQSCTTVWATAICVALEVILSTSGSKSVLAVENRVTLQVVESSVDSTAFVHRSEDDSSGPIGVS